jgi:hypothetical protein
VGIKRDAADAAFSDAVRYSKNYTCEHCNISGGKRNSGLPNMELAHIYGRRHKSIRWDTLNGLCLCSTCHQMFTESPVTFTRWLEGYVGTGYLDILTEKRNTIFKTNKAMRACIAKHYRQELRNMEAGPHDLVSYQ